MISIRWHGRGGQGCFTAARLLGAAAVNAGRYALAFPSFGPERRGAPVLGFTRIDDAPITDRSEVSECDGVVVLDDTLLNDRAVVGLRPGGWFVANTRLSTVPFLPEGVRFTALDAWELARQILGKPIVNTAMLGALIAASNVVPVSDAAKAIEEDPGVNQAEKNKALFLKAWHQVTG